MTASSTKVTPSLTYEDVMRNFAAKHTAKITIALEKIIEAEVRCLPSAEDELLDARDDAEDSIFVSSDCFDENATFLSVWASAPQEASAFALSSTSVWILRNFSACNFIASVRSFLEAVDIQMVRREIHNFSLPYPKTKF